MILHIIVREAEYQNGMVHVGLGAESLLSAVTTEVRTLDECETALVNARNTHTTTPHKIFLNTEGRKINGFDAWKADMAQLMYLE